MTEAEITELVSTQRNYFKTGETLSVAYRIAALKKLKNTILSHENEILAALKADLGKSAHESYMCEAGLALSELTYMIKHTRKFAREKNVHTPLAQFHSRSYKTKTTFYIFNICVNLFFLLSLTATFFKNFSFFFPVHVTL